MGQVCVVLDELPGLAEVDGDALADGEAVAAWAAANVPNPPASARPMAITAFATRLRFHARFGISSSPPEATGWSAPKAKMLDRSFQNDDGD